jgi:hypothetical protein
LRQAIVSPELLLLFKRLQYRVNRALEVLGCLAAPDADRMLACLVVGFDFIALIADRAFGGLMF